MKRIFKNLICCFLTVCLTLGGIWGCGRLLENKTGQHTYDTFKELSDRIDVLYLGSSHMRNDVYPTEIWDDYGIAGYTVGYAFYYIPMNYWALKEALLYNKPKLVVMDVFLLSEVAIAKNTEALHALFDGFPLSKTKIEAVMDLDHTLTGEPDRFDMLFNLSSYHGRWSELDENDLKSYRNVGHGGARVIRLNPDDRLVDEPLDPSVVTENRNIAMDYLERIIQTAQEAGSQVLLTYLPQPSLAEPRSYYNYAYVLAEKYGINYFDMTTVEGLVDYSVDLYDYNRAEDVITNHHYFDTFEEESVYDNNGHLNVSGGNKVSKALGAYIKENYDIPDRRGEKGYEIFDSDFKAWRQKADNDLRKQSELPLYLMQLADDEYDVSVDAVDYNLFWEQPYYNLMVNLQNYAGAERVINDEELLEEFAMLASGLDTASGNNSLSGLDTAAGNNSLSGLDTELKPEAAARVLVKSTRTGETIDFAQFDADGNRISVSGDGSF